MDSTEDYIRSSASARGIDPEIAVRVARSEGLNSYVGDNGSSFGPFQLHYGGMAPGGNRVSGLGDVFTAKTGLHASDPSTVKQQIDFSLDHAAQNGWGPWHGWKGDPRAGLDGSNALGYANEDTTDAPALRGINTALTTKGKPMADNGALTLSQWLGGGALNGNGSPGGPLGGLGPALQDAGSFLMGTSPYTKPPGTEHSAQYMQHAGPQIIDGGTDMFGKKLLYTLRNGQLVRMPVGTQGPNGTSGSSGGGNPAELTQDQFENLKQQYASGAISREEVLKRTGMIGDFAKALAEGTSDPRMMGMKAGTTRVAALDLAHVLYPEMPFDENSISARQAYNRLQATGSANPQTLPGAVNLAGKLADHALKVARSSEEHGKLLAVPNNATANEVQNFIKAHQSDNTFNGARNALNTDVDFYSKEQDRLASGHPTIGGASATARNLNDTLPHPVRMRSLGESFDAALAPLDQMIEGHNQLFGTHKTIDDFLGPKAKADIAEVRDRVARAQQTNQPKSAPANRPPLTDIFK